MALTVKLIVSTWNIQEYIILSTWINARIHVKLYTCINLQCTILSVCMLAGIDYVLHIKWHICVAHEIMRT